MGIWNQPAKCSLALLTDLYELTMAYGYWKCGTGAREAVFHLSYRHNPFNGGFAIACGLHDVVEYLRSLHFDNDDLACLADLKGEDGSVIFDSAFLDFLGRMKFSCDVDAIPEGTVVFPHEPLIRVRGPILQAQILESALLNFLNFPTLVATKAARICQAARGEPVLEYGLRRAQGIDGALTASRAAYVGGCAATSNVLAAKLFGIPAKGTLAHSWVMSFETELEAFQKYAEAMPNNCLFLVDTYDTLAGVRNAVKVGAWLREHGHKLVGVRLDSGDLAYLSIEARRILDEAGFRDAVIVGSNDLDENIIESLKQQGAAINVWGVGTRLVTAYDQPAIDGVYKLSAIRSPDGRWEYKIKLSEQTAKISIPGIQQVRRFFGDGEFMADVIYNEEQGIPDGCTAVDPLDMTRRKTIPPGTGFVDLLLPIFRRGKLVYDPPTLGEVREHARKQVERFHPGIKRILNPHEYPVGLEMQLHELRTRLVLEARGAEKGVR